ncbi:hypothetical protein SAMN04515671_3818 [Nakamurella panacisegetis]|uniref:Uncharacterized protein n=1 Tax=Nakamurella panacisegetis TaxID=1090615 RepID=A0A1H0RZ64_9ACTN|nr:hypothetical protein [Nakamurella panacisegetis]SDP34723.1 hypothetical protein SAMN04515671_3818 [Nakamurella panacisegetis]
MTGQPDFDTIITLLEIVEGRDPAATSVTRFDEDHEVLLSTQAEVVESLAGDAPAELDKDEMRALLDRIEQDIDRNRELRSAVAARQASAPGV